MRVGERCAVTANAKQPTARKALGIPYLLLVLAAVAGMRVDFIPDVWWRMPGSAIPTFLLAGLVAFPLAAATRHDDTGTPGVLTYPPPGHAEQVMRGLLFFMLSLPWAWMATTTTFPWLTTLAVGAPATIEVELHSAPAGGRSEYCAATLRGPLLAFPAKRYLCLAAEDFGRHPERRLRVRLHGLRGATGFRPERYEILADLGPSAR
jgi:hypothetical protein